MRFIGPGTQRREIRGRGDALDRLRFHDCVAHAHYSDRLLVLFDSAPLTAISDNFHLASLVDGVIVVARAGETQKRELARIKAEMERFGARILGVVLNGLPPSAIKQYYGKYYGDYYGYHAGRTKTLPANGWKGWISRLWAGGRERWAGLRIRWKRRDR